MDKVKIWFLLALFLLFVVPGANANIDWMRTGNSNYFSFGGNSYILYGSNSKMPSFSLGVNESVADYYDKCTFPTGDYEPIIADFTRDGIKEVIFVKDNVVHFYNSYCQHLHSWNLGNEHQTITGAPILVTPFYVVNPEVYVLVILTNESIRHYYYLQEFKPAFNDIHYKQHIFWPSPALELTEIMCNNDACLTFASGSSNIYAFNFTVGWFRETPYTLPAPLLPVDGYVGGTAPLPMRRNNLGLNTNYLGNDEVMVCNYGAKGSFSGYSTPSCLVLDIHTGQSKLSFSGGFGSGTGLETIIDVSVGSARFNNRNHYFLTYYYWARSGTEMRTFQRAVQVIDDFGNTIFTDGSQGTISTSPTLPLYSYSNVAVADFTKSGSNEFCYFKCTNTGSEIKLYCYNRDLTAVVNGIDFRSVMNYSGTYTYLSRTDFLCPRISVGDFIGTELDNRLCVATVEGIFCLNASNPVKVFDTGVYVARNPTPQVMEMEDYNKTLGYFMVDKLNSFSVYLDLFDYDTCGDGICQDWENAFTCPEDCSSDVLPPPGEPPIPPGEYPRGASCKHDSDCKGGLICEYGICTTAPKDAECTHDDECTSGICLNGRCTKPTIWQMIDQSKTQQFGDDSPSNNFIALAIMLSVAGMLGFYAGIWIGMASFFMLAIFFTVVGWLNPFILVGLIVVGAIALFFGIMVRHND